MKLLLLFVGMCAVAFGQGSQIQLCDPANPTDCITITVPTLSGSSTLTLPAANASGVLTNNGSGGLSWGSSGGSTAISSLTMSTTTNTLTIANPQTWDIDMSSVFNGHGLTLFESSATSDGLSPRLFQVQGASGSNAYPFVVIPGGGGIIDVGCPNASNCNAGVLEASGGANINATMIDYLPIVITSIATGQVLQYNGTDWVNGTAGTYTGTSPITVSGTAISCSTCLVTGGGQTVTGTDTFTAIQIFNNHIHTTSGNTYDIGGGTEPLRGGYFQSSVDTTKLAVFDGATVDLSGGNFWYFNVAANSGGGGNSNMSITDAGGTVRLLLDQESGGVNANVAYFTMHVVPNSTNTWDLGNSTYYWRNLYLSGTATLSGLTASECVGTNGSSVLVSNSNCVTSISGTTPISVSGGAISCPTCLVTGGLQTITGTDTWSAEQVFNGGGVAINVTGTSFLTSIQTTGGFNADSSGGSTVAFSVDGTGVIDSSRDVTAVALTASGTITFSGLTASECVGTNGSSVLVSNSGCLTSINGLSGAPSIAIVAHQTTLSTSGSTINIGTVQNIDTTSTVTFGSVTAGGGGSMYTTDDSAGFYATSSSFSGNNVSALNGLGLKLQNVSGNTATIDNNTGTLTLLSLSGSAIKCLQANNSGVVSLAAGGCASGTGYTFNTPLNLSGSTVTCPTCVTSAAALTNDAVMIGNGLQSSSTIAVDSTAVDVLLSNSGVPVFGPLTTAMLPYTFSSPISLSGTAIQCLTCVTSALSLTNDGVMIGKGSQASATIAVDSTAVDVLLSNSGVPVFGPLTTAMLPYTFTSPITLSGTAIGCPTCNYWNDLIAPNGNLGPMAMGTYASEWRATDTFSGISQPYDTFRVVVNSTSPTAIQWGGSSATTVDALAAVVDFSGLSTGAIIQGSALQGAVKGGPGFGAIAVLGNAIADSGTAVGGIWGSNFIVNVNGVFTNAYVMEGDINIQGSGTAPASVYGNSMQSAAAQLPTFNYVAYYLSQAQFTPRTMYPFKTGFWSDDGAATTGLLLGNALHIESGTKTFSTLPSAVSGDNVAYLCTNCTQANPTGSGGTGAIVQGVTGTWNGANTNAQSQPFYLESINPTSYPSTAAYNQTRMFIDYGGNLQINSQTDAASGVYVQFQSPFGTNTMSISPGGVVEGQTATGGFKADATSGNAFWTNNGDVTITALGAMTLNSSTAAIAILGDTALNSIQTQGGMAAITTSFSSGGGDCSIQLPSSISSLDNCTTGATYWAFGQSGGYGLLRVSDHTNSGGLDGHGAQIYAQASNGSLGLTGPVSYVNNYATAGSFGVGAVLYNSGAITGVAGNVGVSPTNMGSVTPPAGQYQVNVYATQTTATAGCSVQPSLYVSIDIQDGTYSGGVIVDYGSGSNFTLQPINIPFAFFAPLVVRLNGSFLPNWKATVNGGSGCSNYGAFTIYVSMMYVGQ